MPKLTAGHFSPETFRFLKDIAKHNDKAWFEQNRDRYETHYRDAGLAFVVDAGPQVAKLSKEIAWSAKPVGGSLMRIHRDVRFAKDKSPYKTQIGISFHHRAATEDSPAPGFFLHIGPGESAAYAGLWHPPPSAAARVRAAILARPNEWKKATKGLEMDEEGEKLARPPKGVAPDHPLVEDLKRKSFVAGVSFTDRQVASPRFVADFVAACKKLAPRDAFTARAVGAPW
ncbi:MAG: DUF2461 domain-containing protein [Thermoplasmatota archaeon]